MKKILKKTWFPFIFLFLLSFNINDNNENLVGSEFVCSEITVKNSSYESKNIYIYGTRSGSESWLAASFGLGSGKSQTVDTSGQYGVTWKVYAKGNYGQKTEVYGSCDFTVY